MVEQKQNGGTREGAGRPKGSVNRRSMEAIQEVAARYPDWSPLMHMAAVANNEALDVETRLDAAKSAAPFIHAKLKPVVADADELVMLESRIARARLEAQAEVLDANPSLSDRLARAVARSADDFSLMAATRPVILNVRPAEPRQAGQDQEINPAPRVSPHQTEKPVEGADVPAARASGDWIEKTATAEPYRPLLAWPEPTPTVEVDYDPTYGSYDFERK